MLDWDDLRIFLAIARSKRIAEAARVLALDPTTVSRRLARLEDRLGAPLFETAGGERRLTERGHALFAHAETIESAALTAMGEVGGESRSLSGQVRLSVAEGFATWMLAPGLSAFHEMHPDIRLDIITASGFLNPSKREADIAVMLARPRHGRLIASKLSNYRLRLYAARDFLMRHELPDKVSMLKSLPLVSYVPEFNYSPELDYLNEVSPGVDAVFRSTSINVQYQIIRGGGAIGALPRFIGDRDESLVPIMPEQVEIMRSFWLVSHADMRQLARIDAVTRWLKQEIAPRLM